MYQTTFDLTSECIVDWFTIPYGFKTPECLQLRMWAEAVFLEVMNSWNFPAEPLTSRPTFGRQAVIFGLMIILALW